MAQRPVYVSVERTPYLKAVPVEFAWNGGFAASQKQKNITAMHTSFNRMFPDKKVLEISSKSLQDLGVKLSAFNLKKYVPSIDASVPVECVFQGGKVFNNGGPYTDLYLATPRDAKRDERFATGRLISFYFEGKTIPLIPKTVFYDWIYINALIENPEYAEAIMEFEAFTDVEFNPEKSLNCQAKAAAVFVSLSKQGLLDKCKDLDTYLSLF